MLDVCLLGTGGMMPLPYRWLTSLMMRYNGQSILIDCGEGTQVAHLAYIGDCDMGREVNFGCGSITINYPATKPWASFQKQAFGAKKATWKTVNSGNCGANGKWSYASGVLTISGTGFATIGYPGAVPEYDENGRMNFELPVLNEFALFVISY